MGFLDVATGTCFHLSWQRVHRSTITYHSGPPVVFEQLFYVICELLIGDVWAHASRYRFSCFGLIGSGFRTD